MSLVSGIGAPGAKPADGFDAPFEMLHACHERLHRMTALLARLRAHLRAAGSDEQARQAARDVVRYFDIAAPEHHRDEELHVFPALLALHDPQVTHLVARLQREHVLMDARWPSVRLLLNGLAEGSREGFDAEEDQSIDAFAELYAAHVEAEEALAYPRARAAMEPAALQAMGSDMMARRGVRDPSR